MASKVRWWPAAVVATMAVATAGCGSSAKTATGGSTTTTAPAASSTTATTSTTAPPTTPAPANPTADNATAAAINLTAADLPGYTSSPSSNTGTDSTDAKLAACAGAPDPSKIDVVDVSSPDFSQGDADVSSDVTMVKTADDGKADLAALGNGKLQGCFQSVALPELEQQLPSGAKVTGLQVSQASPPAAVPDSIAFKVSVTVAVPGQGTVTVNDDIDAFLVGRAEVSLDDTVINGTPDTALEAKLVGVLHTRAAANHGTA